MQSITIIIHNIQQDPSKIIKLGFKLHVDGLGHHPSIFFVSLSTFSIDRLFIFKGGYRLSQPLPKFVALGSDVKSRGFLRNTLQELVDASQKIYQVSHTGHKVVFSVDPVILSGDNNVKATFSGGGIPKDQSSAMFEVCNMIIV